MALGPGQSKVQVVAHDPDGHGVIVITDAGHGPGLPIKVLTLGGNDAFRVQQEPLPNIGTWGVASFPYGDNRGGVWMGAYPTNLVDAYTTGASSSPFDRYHAHWSGYWHYQDGHTGEHATMWPDGTTLVANTSGAVLPTMYRHVVDDKQKRQRVPVTQVQRRPAGPTTSTTVQLSKAGTTVTIDPSGNVGVLQIAGTLTLNVSGIGQMVITGSGVTINSASRTNVGGYGEALYRLIDERFVALFNAHIHPTPTGNSSPPTQQMTIGAETTVNLFAG